MHDEGRKYINNRKGNVCSQAVIIVWNKENWRNVAIQIEQKNKRKEYSLKFYYSFVLEWALVIRASFYWRDGRKEKKRKRRWMCIQLERDWAYRSSARYSTQQGNKRPTPNKSNRAAAATSSGQHRQSRVGCMYAWRQKYHLFFRSHSISVSTWVGWIIRSTSRIVGWPYHHDNSATHTTWRQALIYYGVRTRESGRKNQQSIEIEAENEITVLYTTITLEFATS